MYKLIVHKTCITINRFVQKIFTFSKRKTYDMILMRSNMDQHQIAALKGLKKAISLAGSQSELARICGVTRQHVWNWLNILNSIPPKYVLKITRSLNILPSELRPDIYPKEQ